MTWFADRVKDTTTSTGAGAIVLAGVAPTNFQTFAVGLGVGSGARRVSYTIVGSGEWEVGEGMFNGTTGLTRDAAFVRAGSAGVGVLVNFSAGTKEVFLTMTSSDARHAELAYSYASSRGMFQP